MRANPGGTLGPADVFGRDALVSYLRQVLSVQSLVLVGERRIGKTSVINKMAHDCHSQEFVCIRQRDIEGLRSPDELVEATYKDVEHLLERGDRTRLQFWRVLNKLGGTQIGDIRLPEFARHWKSILSALIEDVCRDDRVVVLCWDELPVFLINVKNTHGETAAMEILDVLRSLRQDHRQLRMVFTGSLGLHHVVGGLRRKGYANAPTNDMKIVPVPPLDPQQGLALAALLLTGEGIVCSGDPAEVAQRTSEAASHIPYYIHSLVASLKQVAGPIRPVHVEQQLDALICDPHDSANLSWFRTRLSSHYEPFEAEMALATLDAVASAEKPLAFSDLLNRVRHKIAAEEEALREVLGLLQQDHYLVKQPDDSRYVFRNSIVHRWWKFDRG